MMKTLKSISIFFLLIVLTCGVVFVPQIISGQKEEHILNEVFHRNYSTGNRPKLTNEQVARLYYNREITIGYNSLPLSSENSDTETIRADILDLIELLFGEDETVCEPIKAIITDDETVYSRNSSLIKIDNQPTALNFVTGVIKKENGIFEILYEEKTKAVINIIYDDFVQEFENTKEMDLYLEKVSSMINDYYEKQLYFSKDEYYCIVDMPIVTEKSPNSYIASIHISCGLMQQDDKIIDEEAYYN